MESLSEDAPPYAGTGPGPSHAPDGQVIEGPGEERREPPYLDAPAADFVEGDGPVYALVGGILDSPAEDAAVHIQIAPGAVRGYDPRFLPVFEFFRTPRTERQAREWLAWAGDDGAVLAALLDTRAIVGVDTSSPEAALRSLAGLRLVPHCVPDTESPIADGLVTVSRPEEPGKALLISVELVRALWDDGAPVDLPGSVDRVTAEAGLARDMTVRRMLADVPALLHHGYARLEWLVAPVREGKA